MGKCTYIYFAYFLCTLMVEEQKKAMEGERERENNNIHILWYFIVINFHITMQGFLINISK